MRKFTGCLFALALGGSCLAQQWDVGVAGGLEVYKNLTVTNGSDQASAGFKPGLVVSAFAAQDLYQHLGGEIRYDFGFANMKESSGGTSVDFGAQTHAIHYDFMFYGARRDAKLRPFLLAGGGIKIYRGTGQEQEFQPLANFAILSKTKQIEGLITAGGGVKFQVGHRKFIYLEVIDFITRTPQNVIAPYPPSSISGWVHGFAPMVALSFGF
jgi:hypothetical protein